MSYHRTQYKDSIDTQFGILFLKYKIYKNAPNAKTNHSRKWAEKITNQIGVTISGNEPENLNNIQNYTNHSNFSVVRWLKHACHLSWQKCWLFLRVQITYLLTSPAHAVFHLSYYFCCNNLYVLLVTQVVAGQVVQRVFRWSQNYRQHTCLPEVFC